jgi:hypothetical protein
VDREVLARAGRRRQVLEALEFERDRETVLVEQLEHTLAEADGPGLDETVFAGMEAGDAEIVREALLGPQDEFADEESALEPEPEYEPDPNEVEEEIARLQEELADCRRRQQAFERYLSGLAMSEGQSPTAYAEG